MSENTSIVICGKKFDIGTRVVLWHEREGLNGYDTSKYTYKEQDRKTGKYKTVVVSGKRYNDRTWRSNLSLEKLQGIVNQFFIHHSGLYRSKDTFHVLHNQRRLSVHFILDDDGTLYQTLDVREKSWHGGKNNPQSVGIEIDSRAHASKYPDAYDEAHQKKYGVGPRKKRLDFVNGMWIVGYEYNDKQYETLIRLAIALKSVFPKMKTPGGKFDVDFPRENGIIAKSLLKKPLAHTGLICHYNNSVTKNDAIAFDHYRLLLGIEHCDPEFPTTFKEIDTVGKIQDWLKMLGYDPGPLDGDMGPKTTAAMKKFQEDSGLIPDGIWGLRSNYMLDVMIKRKFKVC